MAVFGIKTNKCKQEVIPAGEIYNAVYPVGSIYMSANDVNPTKLFGGTWEKISGRFLLASSDGRAAGQTGGAETVSYTPAGTVGNHTLTAAEMPKHTHTYAKSATATGSTTLTTAQIPAHTHTYAKANTSTGSTTLTIDQIPAHTHSYTLWMQKSSSTSKFIASGTAYGHNPPDSLTTGSTGGGKGHTHTIATTSTASGSAGSSGGHTHTISTSSTNSGEAGSGGAHNHPFTGTAANISTMSPYLVVNVWKRTA